MKRVFFLITLSLIFLISGCSNSKTATFDASNSISDPCIVEYYSNYLSSKNYTEFVIILNSISDVDGYKIRCNDNEIETSKDKIAIDAILKEGKNFVYLKSFIKRNGKNKYSKEIPFELFYYSSPNGMTYYLKDDGTYEISCKSCDDNEVKGLVYFPDYINDIKVTRLADNCLEREVYYVYPTGTFPTCENTLTEEVRLPKYLEVIGKECFNTCKNIKKIQLPDTVKVIKDDAFSGCEKLSYINIPDGIDEINCFYGCESLKSITLPNSVKTLGNDAFYLCVNLESINLENIELISPLSLEHTYWLDNQTGFVIIADTLYRFNGEPTTKELRIEDYPSNFKYVSPRLFEGKSSVEYVEIPPCIKNITSALFNKLQWNELKTVLLNEGIVEIGEIAFSDLKSLESVVIPNTIKTIRNAFQQETRYKHKITLFYEGTLNEWELIDIDSRVYEGDIEVYYYSEAEPETQGNYWHYENNEIIKW